MIERAMEQLVYEAVFGPGNEPRCHVVHDAAAGQTRIWIDGVSEPVVPRGGEVISISFGIVNPNGNVAQLRVTRAKRP